MVKPVYSITPFTLLDYPNRTACILWFAGCNMRCLYCYNPEIVLGKGTLGVEEVTAFLRARQGLLQAVVFSGGECTIHPAFPPLVALAKELGYLVKVDTNGTRPRLLSQMIESGSIDYVALDFKSHAAKHEGITKSHGFAAFSETLDTLQNMAIPFEVRTTWHSKLLDTADLRTMVDYLEERGYSGSYYVQRFFNGVPTLAELPDMYEQLDTASLSTENIQVVVRNG